MVGFAATTWAAWMAPTAARGDSHWVDRAYQGLHRRSESKRRTNWHPPHCPVRRRLAAGARPCWRQPQLQRANALALEYLCEGGKKLWDNNYANAKNYTCSICPNGEIEVRRRGNDAAVRVLHAVGRCNCNKRIAFLAPCCHEICADAMEFNLERWPDRYRQRRTLEISLACNILPVGEHQSERNNLPNLATEEAFEDTDCADGFDGGADDFGGGTLALDVPVSVTVDQNVSVEFGPDRDDVSIDSDAMAQCIEHADKENSVARPEYGQLMNMAKEFVEVVMKSRDWRKHSGMMCRMIEIVRGNNEAVTDEISFEDFYRKYCSSFASRRATKDLFASSTNRSTVPSLLPRTPSNGRPTTKRMKSRAERLIQSQRKTPQQSLVQARRNAPSCSFCYHQRRNCSVSLNP
jgi:hypothetical protein